MANLARIATDRARIASSISLIPLMGFLALAPAQAVTVFSVTESGAAASVQYLNGEADLGDSMFGSCTACATSTAVAGSFDVSITSASSQLWTPVSGNTETVSGLGGSVLISNGSGTLLSGTFDSLNINAVPLSSSATIQLNLSSANSTLLGTLPAGTLYLDISGTTVNPVTVNSGNGTFDSIALDWSAALNTVPQIQAVPLPAAAWLMLSGIGGLGVLARKRRAV